MPLVVTLMMPWLFPRSCAYIMTSRSTRVSASSYPYVLIARRHVSVSSRTDTDTSLLGEGDAGGFLPNSARVVTCTRPRARRCGRPVGAPAGGCGRREESVRSVTIAVRRAAWEPRIPPPGDAFEDARADTAGRRPASGLTASGRTTTVASAFLSIVNAQSTCDRASACGEGATPPDSDALFYYRAVVLVFSRGGFRKTRKALPVSNLDVPRATFASRRR